MRNVKVGDKIYVGSSFYLSHGIDDFVGGQATVFEVGDDTGMYSYVRITERPDSKYNWAILSEKQEELEARFKEQRAHCSPDNREEFNED